MILDAHPKGDRIVESQERWMRKAAWNAAVAALREWEYRRTVLGSIDKDPYSFDPASKYVRDARNANSRAYFAHLVAEFAWKMLCPGTETPYRVCFGLTRLEDESLYRPD